MRTTKTFSLSLAGNLALLVWVLLFTASCSKKDDAATTTTATHALVIGSGATAVKAGKQTAFDGFLVDVSGNKVTGTVTYTVSPASLGTFNGNVFTARDSGGTGVVTATTTYNGVSYTTQTPVNVLPATPSVFTVAPAAIIWTTGAGTIPLDPVYIGVGTAAPTYTYTSKNTAIVTVSTTGEVSFIAPGSTSIDVSATINGKASTFTVPVLVVGAPVAPLPVTRVVISKKSWIMFKGETQAFTVKAYNSSNVDVTSQYKATWTITPKDTTAGTLPITVDTNGLVTASSSLNFADENTLTDAYLRVTVAGISDVAEISVQPDKFLFTDPFYLSLGGIDPLTLQPGPSSASVTVKAYAIDHAKFHANNDDPAAVSVTALPTDVTWTLFKTGISLIDQLMDVATISPSTGATVTVTKKDAPAAGSTFIIAASPSSPDLQPGIVSVTVTP